MAKHERSGERERHWRSVMARFIASELSVKVFCNRQRISEATFYFWRRTLRERDVEAASQGKAAFLPVMLPVQEPAKATSEITVELSHGVVIRCGQASSIERIVSLVRALRTQEASR